MILVILAAVLAGVAFVLLVRVFWAKAQPSGSSLLLTTAAIVLVAGLGVLAATGRLHWLAAAGAAVFPFLRRGFSVLRFWPLLRRLAPMAGQAFGTRQAHAADAGSGAEQSEVETADLRMTLHHGSGEMDGEVLTGAFAGRRLSTLPPDDLRALRTGLSDPDSVRLLDSYLERHHPGWGDTGGRGDAAQASEGQMTERGRALEVLGLEAGASREEIVEAHRRLIQKLHPDRGGSTYLARNPERGQEGPAVAVGDPLRSALPAAPLRSRGTPRRGQLRASETAMRPQVAPGRDDPVPLYGHGCMKSRASCSRATRRFTQLCISRKSSPSMPKASPISWSRHSSSTSNAPST